jgi:hypothetical protein
MELFIKSNGQQDLHHEVVKPDLRMELFGTANEKKDQTAFMLEGK